MKKVVFILSVVLVSLQSCEFVTDIEESKFCCKYQSSSSITPAVCVTVNGDCTECELLCKKFPVRKIKTQSTNN